MFKRDDVNHVNYMQNDDPKTLNNLFKRMSFDLGFIMDDNGKLSEDAVYATQINLYKIKLRDVLSKEEYDRMLNLWSEFRSKNFSNLIETLFRSNYSFALPDSEYFRERYKNSQTITDSKELDKTLKEDAMTFYKTIERTIDVNKKFAKEHEIPYVSPKSNNKTISKN